MSDPEEHLEPGWHPAVEQGGPERYWDGSGWTRHRKAPKPGMSSEAKVGLLVLALIAFVGFLSTLRDDDEDRAESSSTFVAPTTLVVLYEVEGTPAYADVTLQTPTGIEQITPDVPLVTNDGDTGLTYAFSAGDPVYVSVQKTAGNGGGSITCRISINGRVVSENTSTASYGIATCSGVAG